MSRQIYKVVSRQLWAEVTEAGVLRGADVDVRDGFIHFSAAHQVAETVAKHFSGQDDLLLIEVDAGRFGEALRWESSRGGDLFPHLYGGMPLDSVLSVVELPLAADGHHVFPPSFNVNSSSRDE